MKRVLLSTLFTICFALVAVCISNAQNSSVAGEWDGAFNTPGGTRPFKFVLEVDGEKLTGTAKRSSGDVPIKGTIKGDAIEFSYTINYGGNDLTMTFSGKVSGDKMGGVVTFGGQAEEAWSAERAKAEKP
ncbi:MAG: hypothetical protein KF685_06630 [Acidobacteria bacterium]|nr:hypothetical protein [Acidobacteriota bacterium]